MRAVLTTNAIICILFFFLLLYFTSGTGSSQAQQINDENQQNKYCRLSSQHTLCKFQGIDEKCGPILARGVDEKSKQMILHIHNTLRSLVAFGKEIRGQPGPQPRAANMQLMVWDEELSAIAQRHSEQCQFEHDCNECRKVDRFPVGQNLGVEWTTGPSLNSNWKKVVTKWYEDEVHQFPNTSSQSYRFAASTGHYSQLVWANSNRVGCGYTSFRNSSISTNLFVCNYGPAGNFLGLPVYKMGSPCSQCPLNTACNPKNTFPNLCETTKKKSENTSAISSPLSTDGGSSGVRGSLNKPINRLSLTNSDHSSPTKMSLPDAVATPTSSLLMERNFTCRIGDNQCRAVFRGAAWSFKTESSLISPIFLEAVVKAGEHTELQIIRHFKRSLNSTNLCMSFKFRQETVSFMPDDNGELDKVLLFGAKVSNEWSAPPMFIKIKPENNNPEVVVPVRSNEEGKWVQINIKFSIPSSPSFRLYFQQSGPLFDGKLLDPSVSSAVSFRVALEKLQLGSGKSC